jgi:hypothetical protein
METDDPFDLEKFRLRPEDLKAYTGKAAAAPRARHQFTIVPRSWSDRLAAARHVGTYKFALHLLHQILEERRTTNLTNQHLCN